MDGEILFRGRRLDGKGWGEGDLVHSKSGFVFIKDPSNCEYGLWENGHYCGNHFVDKVDPSTVGRYTGKQIAECDVTDDNAHLKMKKVWQDDLIAIYSINCDDDDNPVRTHVATVWVKWDENYQMLFAECVKGSMCSIVEECDISYLDSDQDYPFTFWLEYMENSNSQFWEWEICGNTHDNPELVGGQV